MPRTRADKDYYRTLGVRPEATEEEIRKAYRRLALQWHPDRNQGKPEAEERFKEISEAYAVLIDPATRREYDGARHAGAAHTFHRRREDLFQDLFRDPRASDVFEDLAREFERMGLRVDRHAFRQTLFGGPTIVTGRVIIIGGPFPPLLALGRLARAALRAAWTPTARPVGAPAPDTPIAEGRSARTPIADRPREAARPVAPPAGILDGIARAVGWFLGLAPAPAQPSDEDITLGLRLTTAEAEHGGRHKLSLDRGDRMEDVLVKIPRGLRPGTRLRLRGKGRPRPDGSRGDLYLAVEIVDRD
jgi:curved DNA-binding protein CbpA